MRLGTCKRNSTTAILHLRLQPGETGMREAISGICGTALVFESGDGNCKTVFPTEEG